MRSVLLAVALMLGACESMGGHGHGGDLGRSSEHHAESRAESHGESRGESRASSSVGPALVRAALPVAEAVAEAIAAGGTVDADPPEPPGAPARDTGGPLIDDHDPCNQCPDDRACGECTGADGAVCTFAPAGAFARCASSN